MYDPFNGPQGGAGMLGFDQANKGPLQARFFPPLLSLAFPARFVCGVCLFVGCVHDIARRETALAPPPPFLMSYPTQPNQATHLIQQTTPTTMDRSIDQQAPAVIEEVETVLMRRFPDPWQVRQRQK